MKHPSYRQVCTKTTGHAETVEVVFDPAALPARTLLTAFFTLHDCTRDRAGKDGRGQYRSAIFYRAEDRHLATTLRTAYAMIAELEAAGLNVSTQIRPISAFYPAANRHQQYCAAQGITPNKREMAAVREILTSGGT